MHLLSLYQVFYLKENTKLLVLVKGTYFSSGIRGNRLGVQEMDLFSPLWLEI